MTRAPIFLGVSLKMYLDHEATLRWVTDVVATADSEPAVRDGRVRVAVLPTFVSVDAVAAATRGTPVAVGAQDLAWADHGAFTGEVSGRDLASLGCRYVEVGHAERRQLFGEDDKIIASKLAAAARNGLIPILCVGEQDHLSPERAVDLCRQQVLSALAEVDSGLDELIIAYEPVWAIGAEQPADADHVRAVCRQLRAGLADDHRTEQVRVIYGGSAGPGLLTELGDAVDGLFLGRFAHDPEAFGRVIGEAAAMGRS
ncbi:triose-phosphate isomerase family protein [Microlunatus soli]|uniref:Triosephosphate isomerase n=1 Tax=Microlunatus soli TaxID=630515 RepID=A0A1H2APX1_9ACTN|nr:triose-phosphate isomerase family protein [Microlunatus soli]SDT47859.1 triosephosphate isomerase [Microlunatus soli]